MSSTSRQSAESHADIQPSVQNRTGAATPARREAPPRAKGGELTEEIRQELRQLAELANQAHDSFHASLRKAVADAFAAGNALLKAKDLCPEKRWTQWLKANFRFSASTARGYMRLAALWPQLEGDQQPVVDLTYKDVLRRMRGLPNADGRANTGRSAARRRLAPPTAQLKSTRVGADADTAQAGAPALPPQPATDLLDHFGQLLHQAIVELRRVIETSRSEAPYARHLLQPLERIDAGLAGRQWHWDGLSPRR